MSAALYQQENQQFLSFGIYKIRTSLPWRNS